MCEITTHSATKQIKDHLAIFSSIEEMMETMNILKYRFSFDFEYSDNRQRRNNEKQEEKEIIEQIFSMSVFFADNTFKIPEELFGANDFYWNHEKEIEKAIHSHCVISALHTVKYLMWLEGEKVIKGTTAIKYVNEDPQKGTPGYFFLKSLKYDVSQLDMARYDYESCESYESYESKVSNFWRHIKNENLENNISFAYSLLGKNPCPTKANKNNFEIPLYNLDLYHKIMSHKKFFMNKTHYTKSLRREYFIKYMNLYGRIASSVAYNATPEAKVDNILLRYQLERYFNALLYEHLFQKHKYHHEDAENKIILSGDNYFKIIQKFSLLPNVFSRHIFADWAYESISRENSEKVFVNYFDSPTEMKFGMIYNENTMGDMKFNPRLKTPNTEYSVWCYVLESALEYLSTVTFPMYEKTFFICLYEYFSHDISEKGKTTVLQKMEKVLYWYCVKECEEMFDSDTWERQPSFLSWDCNDGEQYTEEKQFYLNLINEMLDKNNLEALYKITFDRRYFGGQGEAAHSRETATINYYQRQLMCTKNKSDDRKISF